MESLAIVVALAWLGLLLTRSQPWRILERLEAGAQPRDAFLSDTTVLIPARNEAMVIERTLAALRLQGAAFQVVLVNDQSSDETEVLARSTLLSRLKIVSGEPLPAGWIGKLWALQQGLESVETDFVLLLDADIELASGMVATLRQKLVTERLDLVSIMAELRMENFWEKLLVPAFVYFFRLLYPFSRGNNPRSSLGVAAGGCIFIRSQILRDMGGFAALRDAIIDDCSLANLVKARGGRTWIGLSQSVRSHRVYSDLATFWHMVARSAFTQLRYSTTLLLATTVGMVSGLWTPILGLFWGSWWSKIVCLIGLCAMTFSYLPTLLFYHRSGWRALTLPMAGTLYVLMTWSSAIRYWKGQRSEWKGRVYHSR
jgi:hopene-associated glycosyltransferase HpnB